MCIVSQAVKPAKRNKRVYGGGGKRGCCPGFGSRLAWCMAKTRIRLLCQKKKYVTFWCTKYEQPARHATNLLTFETALKYQRANGVEEPFLKGEWEERLLCFLHYKVSPPFGGLWLGLTHSEIGWGGASKFREMDCREDREKQRARLPLLMTEKQTFNVA